MGTSQKDLILRLLSCIDLLYLRRKKKHAEKDPLRDRVDSVLIRSLLAGVSLEHEKLIDELLLELLVDLSNRTRKGRPKKAMHGSVEDQAIVSFIAEKATTKLETAKMLSAAAKFLNDTKPHTTEDSHRKRLRRALDASPIARREVKKRALVDALISKYTDKK